MERDFYEKEYMEIRGNEVSCKENKEWITINLYNNPNLLADSVYLLNKLWDEKDVLYGHVFQNKKEILEKSILKRLPENQKKIFLDWQEVTQLIAKADYGTRQNFRELFLKKKLFSLEEKANFCVAFQELINDIKDKKEKKFKEQFYASYSLDDSELSESTEIYHYLHPFENEKIVKSMNNIEQLFIDLVSPSSSTKRKWGNQMDDVVRASLILKRKLSSTQLKNDLFKRMVEPHVFSDNHPNFNTFMETTVNPYLKKNPATDPDYSYLPIKKEQEQIELFLTNEVEPYYLLALKEIRKGFRKASTDLFTHIYLHTTIEEKRYIIDGYAKQYLTTFDYLDFMLRTRQQRSQGKWNENDRLQESLHLLVDGKSRRAYEERAYYLAYLEETTLPNSLKDTLKYLLLNELTSAEKAQALELVPEKRQLLLLTKELDRKTVYELEAIQQGKKQVTDDYFLVALAAYKKTDSKKHQERIKEQAKKYLTESKYVEFEIHTQFQDEFRKKSVTQPNVDFQENGLSRFLKREYLSANEVRAFYLAYLDAQKLPNNIQIIFEKVLIKDLTDKEKKEVITLYSEKRQLLLLAKYLESDIVFELEKIQQGKKRGTDDYFRAIYNNSDSILAREMIKEQAQKYLTESNYLAFDINNQLQEESRKTDFTLPTVDFKDEVLRYFIDHEVSSKSEMIIYYLAYLEAKEIPSDLETIKNLKKNVATPNQIDIDELILEKKQLLTIVNEIGPSAYERLRYDIGVSIGFFTEMYEKVNSVDTQQFIKNQAQLSLDAEKHLEFKKRIALYELSKSSKLTFEVDSFIQRQRHSQQKNGENYRTKISLEDIGRLREHNLSSLAERMVYVQKSTEEIESKKNDEPKSVKEELQVFLALISRFDDDDKYRYMDSHFENIYSSVKKKSHNGKHILSLPKKNKALNKLKNKWVLYDEERGRNWQSVLELNKQKQSNITGFISRIILLPTWQSVAEIEPLFIAVKKRIEKRLERFSQEVKASQSKTDKEILDLAEKDPEIKELLTYYQKIAPAVPLKDFAKTTPTVVAHFKNSAHQLVREDLGEDTELSEQIYELGKQDLPFCADLIQYLASTGINEKAKDILISPNEESQRRAKQIIEIYNQKLDMAQQKNILETEKKQQIENDTQLKELVRNGVFNFQKDKRKEIHIGQANADSFPSKNQLQQFIKELAEKLDTNRQREAAIQTVMKPNLSLEEREEFYAYLKNDPFLPLFLQKDNLSKLELKAYVDVCLKKTDLSFKGKISGSLRAFLTIAEKEKLNKLIAEKEVIRAVAEEINHKTALEFERVINQNKQEIDPLVAVYRQTSFTPIREFVLQHVDSSLTGENCSEFYQKIDSVAPINYLDQKKWEAPSTNKNVKQENDSFFSLIDEMKETLEQQKLVYYFPEIVKHILPPKIRNLEDIDKEYQITRERLEEIGIHFTDEQMQKWIDTFDEGPIVNDNYHISILKTIAKVIEENMERKGTLRENIPTDKAENNIVKEELIAAIEQSVVKINKDDSDKSVEEKFRDHLSNYPIILNLIKEQPEIGKKLLKKCQDRLPFVSLTSSKEFREIVDNEFAIRNTNIRKFARKHAPQVRSQMTVEKQIYDLYQENPAWCCENLRAILVDYAGFKNINLNPIYRPKLYSFQADGDSDKWRLLGKAQKITDFYTGIASDLKKILPKELQQKESVDKESQTEILTESTVSEHKKLNNNMMDLTETDGKKRLFPTTDHFEPKSNLGQMKPLEKKLRMTQIKEKASQEGHSSNERKPHEQVQRQANR
ncbi:hypothetical protein ACKO9L_001841 [Enterococcus hirae]|uniref:hypothetical protein n=1 Tax=Enterococcus hirae TaxID=1354 RepID=UPI001D183882|nr:hypothetical protein [Enterococcus hirae]MCC4035433.1 hypothetical protein [Enterococcus hirae]